MGLSRASIECPWNAAATALLRERPAPLKPAGVSYASSAAGRGLPTATALALLALAPAEILPQRLGPAPLALILHPLSGRRGPARRPVPGD